MTKLKIAIIDIIGIPYDGTTVFKQGLGGSESAVTLVSKELAQLGFDVTVFNNCNIDHASPGLYDDVVYRPLTDLTQDFTFDIVISSRTVIPFVDPANYGQLSDRRAFPFQHMDLYNRILSKAKMRILWMHDTFCLGDLLIEELALANRITNIFTLSDWHLTYVANCDHGKRRNFEVLKKKFFITRNGANNYIPEVDIRAKDRNLFVYNASVSKGMAPLVEHIWPRVKHYIPTAQLKIIGGYYRFSSNDEPDEQEKKWRSLADDPANPSKGIEFTGIIPQKEIAEILAKANFMIYPAAFPETFGISTLESLLYNTPSITCRFGALEEIAIEDACYLIDYAIEPNSLFQHIHLPSQVDKFVETVVRAYNNTYLHQQKQYYCNIIKDVAGWDVVAKQWRQLFFKETGNYLPVDDYREVSKLNHKIHKIWKRRYHNTIELESYKSGVEQEIVVISTFYNCQHLIGRCIESVAAQDYTNYKHILVDDCSTDDSFMAAIRAIHSLPEHLQSKFTVIKNEENKGAMRNQVEVIRSLENNEAIVMILDGDDTLVNDNSIFSYYNTVYDGTTEFTYGSCWSMVDNIPLISQPYPEDVKQRRDYRNHHFNWIMPYTHLRTFKKRLMNGQPDRMFTRDNGEWYKAGGDGSLFYALIESADPNKVKCLQEVVYNYDDTSPLNDYKINGAEQTRNAQEIIAKRRIDKYSVVVPTMWRVAEQFVGFLEKLCDHPAVDEIIIINNDNTKTPQGLTHPKIKMFDFGKNIFVNPAWNFGVKTARNSRVCIVNDDVVFDLDVFDKLQDMLVPENGLFGLHPGTPEFNHIPVTTKSIDVLPWTGQHTYGYGCLMFLNKDIWSPIPDGLDIYYGDNFIFDLQLGRGKTNYIIANMDHYTQFAVTTSDKTVTSGVLDRETPIYNEIKSDLLSGKYQAKEALTPITTIQETKKKPMNNKRILIGIPTAKNIEVETFKAIYDLEIPEGYEVDFQYFYGYNIDQVRNLIAHWTLNYDYLFSVDSDIAFERDTLKKLLAHNVDIVSGLYIQRRPGAHVLELYEHNSHGGVSNIPYGNIKDRGLVEIAGCGFGCVLVKSEVFRVVGYPQFEYHSALDHAHTISEDNDFCRKARDKGFRVWADTSIQCRHIGSFTFTIDNNIPAVAKDETDVKARLKFLGSHRLLPNQHVDYLGKIRDEYGFTPKVAYDIGACVLHWTDGAKFVWPDAEYVAFEAMDSAEFIYQDHGMKYHMGLLSDKDDQELTFWQNEMNPGGNSYYRENSELSRGADILYTDANRKVMKSVTLDTVVRERNFPLPDLIKMDVQGAELDVLKGATETLKNAQHVILELQAVEYNKGAPLREVIIDYMDKQGFECKGLFCDNGPDGDYHFVRKS